MEYSKIDKLGVNPSLLGFGCMRFPKKEDGTIDEVEAERMLDHAIESGVTYIDTAYPYHDGESEPFVGRVLKKYKRKDYYLATKLPMFKINSLEQAKEIFDDTSDTFYIFPEEKQPTKVIQIGEDYYTMLRELAFKSKTSLRYVAEMCIDFAAARYKGWG